ncbi:DUF3313 domain-containing protein [Nitrococcus mobilis]|uniref:Lipoprotein, putative n=1 Tax=Nitrococcus mobilis Nb-231 TaxID=314278 RepID=A4BRI2_9GAMM|nr:DUF3313 domain-containing protein [Nitrococcus mobilis]EAR21553.1 lipoprotein, putative [Nitrococcus mobilis Nb-231]
MNENNPNEVGTNVYTRTNHARQSLARAALLALAVALAGCSATQKEKPKLEADGCAMIPPNICEQLTPGTKNQAGLRYVTPDVPWSQYTKVMISPVTVWGGEQPKLSGADRQALASYLHNALVKAFEAKFPTVDKPGPGVIRIQAAISDAEAATPVLRSVSMAIPQAHVLSTLKYAATGTYPFVGSAQGEVMATDAVTGKVLAAGVDRRVGGGSVATAAQWEWGDAENAMDKWAEMTVTRFENLRVGK